MRFVHKVSVAAAGGMLLVPLAVSAPATAAPAVQTGSARSWYYGAISVAMTDGAGGYSYDYGTKKSAKRAAQRACKNKSNYPSSCRKIVWVRNGCAAVVAKYWSDGSVRRYAWGIGSTKRQAINRAKAELNYTGRTNTWVCTTR